MGAAFVTFLNVLGSILKVRGHDDLGQYARLAASLIHEGAEAKDEFEEIAAELQDMVDRGVDPTPDQVATVRNRRKELSAALQASLAETETEEEEPEVETDTGDDEAADPADEPTGAPPDTPPA